jgi:hypothetical protein
MRKLSLITTVGVVLALSTGVAAAATTPSLSSTEYQQLISFQGAASAGSLKTLGAVEAAQRRCHALSPVSQLMRSDRTDCNASFEWVEASFSALGRLKACAHTTTLATRFSCLRSAYVRLERTVRALHHAEQRVYHATLVRGFTGACVRALSDGPKALAHEAQMGDDLAKMLSAMRRRSLLATQNWGRLYDAATAETEAASSRASVGVCPHQ